MLKVVAMRRSYLAPCMQNCLSEATASSRKPKISFRSTSSETLNTNRDSLWGTPELCKAGPMKLTQDQIKQFRDDGYIVLENFSEQAELDAMRAQANILVDDFDAEEGTVFSTKKQTSNAYFMDSANNISCFFEEKAHGEDGKLKQAKHLSINKIGHAMHDQDPVFKQWSRSKRMTEVLKQLGMSQPVPVQSMYIFKQPNIGGEVVPHQDSTFLYTTPDTTIGVWIALEDSTVDNGCLWTLPGEHAKGVRRRMQVRNGQSTFDCDAPSYDLSAFKPLEMKAGSMVILHGANVHFSNENTSPKSRHAYSVHYVERDAGWPAENW